MRIVATVGNDGDLAPWGRSMPKKQCVFGVTNGTKAGRKRKRVKVNDESRWAESRTGGLREQHEGTWYCHREFSRLMLPKRWAKATRLIVGCRIGSADKDKW